MASPDSDPLAGIDDVDWAAVSHAYGPATDVPELLRELATGPPPDGHVLNTYDELYGNLCHQGTRYPATVVAIPFLIRLLAHPRTASKEHLLTYLSALALGLNVEDSERPTGVAAAKWLAEEIPSLVRDPDAVARLQRKHDAYVAAATNDRDRKARQLLVHYSPPERTVAIADDEYQCYCAVQDGIDAILGCFAPASSDPAVARAYAAGLCAWFPAVQYKTYPALVQLLAHEPDAVIRGCALYSMALTEFLRKAMAAADASSSSSSPSSSPSLPPVNNNPAVLETLQAAYNDGPRSLRSGRGADGGVQFVRWIAALGLLRLGHDTPEQRALVLRTRTADGAAELAAAMQQAKLDAMLFSFGNLFSSESIINFVGKETKDL